MSEDVKVAEEIKPDVTEAIAEPAEVKPAQDEKVLRLATLEEEALEASAKAECNIAASQSLKTYSDAGKAHLNTILCRKASLDYESTRDGVASKWNGALYQKQIDSIMIRVRATSPEFFIGFDALRAKSSIDPARAREKIQRRILVGMVAEALVPLMGEKTWDVPYRLVANYLIVERVFHFDEIKVEGAIKAEHVGFLKDNLLLLVEGKHNTASFLTALQAHFDAIKAAAVDAVNANKTPEQRVKDEKIKTAKKEAGKQVASQGAVKKALAESLAASFQGVMPTEEILTMIKNAADNAKIVLPKEEVKHQLDKIDVEELTTDDLSAFLKSVTVKGGSGIDERRKLIQTIIRIGSELADKRKAKADRLAARNGHAQHANGHAQLALAN